MMEFNLGDIVKLKSGSCKMIVSSHSYQHNPYVLCFWHDKKGVPRQSEYRPELLKIVVKK